MFHVEHYMPDRCRLFVGEGFIPPVQPCRYYLF